MTAVQLASAGIESTLFEERFNDKAVMLAGAQYMRSGAMEGVENQRDAEQIRSLNKSLRDQQAGDITMSPQQIQDTRDEIGRLTDKAARENQRLADQFEKLRQEGRFDVIAEMIALDNREMFLDWALSFDQRQIVVDGTGAARTEDGRLASGYGSRMDSQLQGITEQQKKQYREELNDVRSRKRVVRGMVDLGGFVGTPLSSGRASLVAQTESPEQGYILLADEEGNMVLNIDQATLEALPQEQQELLEEAAEYAASAKGGARIVVHTNKQSLEAATGVKNAAYLEASEEQRQGGMQDEVHVLLQDGGEMQLRTDLVHEAGHFRFRDSVNDDAARKKMVEELTQLANQKPGSFLNELYNAVQDAYSDKSVEDQEKELINHFVQAVAQGATVVNNSVLKADLSELTGGLERWGMADLFGKKKVSSLDAVIMAQQFAQEVSKTTELYGAFTRQDFENLAEHQERQRELEQKQYSPQEEGEVDDSIVAMESRTLEFTKKRDEGAWSAEDQVKNHFEDADNVGSTFSVDGKNVAGQPLASVSIFNERSEIIKEKLTPEALQEFADKNKDILDGNGDVLSIGTWLDSSTGETYLDIVATVDKESASELGREYNQKAVFDLETFTEIETGGTGEAVEGLKPEVDRIQDIRRIAGKEKARSRTRSLAARGTKDSRGVTLMLRTCSSWKRWRSHADSA